MPEKLTVDKSTLVQVMAWCRQATSHYLNQCWPRSPTPYGVTRPQWVNSLWPSVATWWHRSGSTLAQAMACCLSAPSHFLNQFWLIIIKSPRYTGGDFMFLYLFVPRRRSRRRPQILVQAITFQQLFGFLSFLAGLLTLTYKLTD